MALTGRVYPRASGYRGHQELPTKNMGGAGTKSIQGRKKESWMVAASPPTPSIPGDDSEAPSPSTTVGAAVGRPGEATPCLHQETGFSLQSTSLSPSLQGSLVLRNFLGQRPQGSCPHLAFKAAEVGHSHNNLGFREGWGGPIPPAGPRSPRSWGGCTFRSGRCLAGS